MWRVGEEEWAEILVSRKKELLIRWWRAAIFPLSSRNLFCACFVSSLNFLLRARSISTAISHTSRIYVEKYECARDKCFVYVRVCAMLVNGGGGKSLGATIVETKVDRAKSWTCCRGSEVVSSWRLTGNCPCLGRVKPARHVFVHFFTGAAFFAPRNISDQVPTPAGISVLFSRIFSTLVSNILRSVFSAWRRDFFSFSFFFF